MTTEHRGPLARLRSWNHRRLEARRFRRQLWEALADDDAAIMAALTRFIEEARAERAANAAALEALSRRVLEARAERAADAAALEALARRVLEARAERAANAAALEALARRVEGIAGGQAELGSGLEKLGASLGEWQRALEKRGDDARSEAVDAFPSLATQKEWLLEPELSVIAHLSPWLSPRLAIDVGAHLGRFSGALLDLGFEVHALEPNPSVRAELVRRLEGRAGLTVHACAAGAEDGQGSLSLVADASGRYSDATQFSSLAGLEPPGGLVRAGTVTVPIRRLDVLVRELGLPSPAVVKVDAEGYDLEVLRGLGELRPPLLLVEFWDDALPFSGPGARNRLPDLVAHARANGAPFHLAVFRRWGDDRPAFFSSYPASPEKSWGNVLFFRDRALFEEARLHVATLVPEARFVPGPRGA